MLLPELVEPTAAHLQPAERVLPQAPRRLILGGERLLDDEAMILLSGGLQFRERALVRLLPSDPASRCLLVYRIPHRAGSNASLVPAAGSIASCLTSAAVSGASSTPLR